MTDVKFTARTVLGDGYRLVALHVRAHPVAFSIAVFGAVVFASAIVAAAIVIGQIAESLIIPVLDEGADHSGRVVPAVAAVIAISVWKAAGIALRRGGASWFLFMRRADIRIELIRHQLKLRLAWFNKESTGDLLAISDSDAGQSTWMLGPLPYGVAAVSLLVGTVVLITVLDPLLGLLTLVALAAIAVIDIYGGWRTFEAFQNVQRMRGKVTSVAHESVDGALTVKALGREEFEGDRFQVVSETLRDQITWVGRVYASFRAVVEGLPAMTTVALLILGAFRIRAGSISPGDLVTIAYLMSLLTIPVRLIGFVLWDVAESLAGWQRVERILTVDDFVTYGDLAASAAASGADVAGVRVGFSYDGVEKVLESLQLEIPSGATVAVVGPTGSGKSTLTLLMARLWDPSSGRIELEGRDLRDFAFAALPQEIAYVAQDSFLFDDTVEANVTMGQPFSTDEIDAALALAGAVDFVEDLPLRKATHIGERGVTLSGGQRQRIALARALIRQPRLLILDDATSSVDASVETAILTGLREAELPSTVVIVAYRQSSITLADLVVFIDDGLVVAHGAHQELLASVPGYERLLTAYEEDAAARAAQAIEAQAIPRDGGRS